MTERLADRLARTFGGFDRSQIKPAGWQDGDDTALLPELPGDDRLDVEAVRFPVRPNGYDRLAVDHYVDVLEREVEELRTRAPAADAVSVEITRIGSQASTILQAAHDAAEETKREAQAEADRCLGNAASNALAITAEAQERLRQLDSETDHVWRERERLLDDVRAVTAALASLVEDAAKRFPGEPEPAAAPVPTGPLPAAAAVPTGPRPAAAPIPTGALPVTPLPVAAGDGDGDQDDGAGAA